MELNQLIFQTKLRSSWQVYDLTLLVLRQFGVKVFFIWAALALPIAAVTAVLFSPAVAGYIIWWLKPVFERPLLHYYSRAIFAEPVTVKQSLLSLRGINWRDWLRILTWHRLRWRRAYLAPVDQLEQLSGARRQQRERTLLSFSQDQQGFWLMFCVHLESLLVLVAVSMLWTMVPQGWSPHWTLIFEQSPVWLAGVLLSLYLIAMGLVAPLFTLGGFLLYLNRRIELEAWDLELAFKTLLKRIRPALSGILLVCLLALNVDTPVYANEQHPSQSEAESDHFTAAQHEIAAQVTQIYQREQLIESKTSWQVKPEQDDTTEVPRFWLGLLTWLGKSIAYLAWAAVIGVTVVLLFWLYRNASKLKLQQRADDHPHSTAMPLFFADIAQQASAEQLLQLATQYLDSGEYRRALACMLRAAIILVQNKFNVVLSANMTEQECLSALQQQLPAQYGDMFQLLFKNWITSAWAHQSVVSSDLTNILAQLRQWLPAAEPMQ